MRINVIGLALLYTRWNNNKQWALYFRLRIEYTQYNHKVIRDLAVLLTLRNRSKRHSVLLYNLSPLAGSNSWTEQNSSNSICSLFVTMSLIIQIYDAANLELFLESDLNRGHLEYSHLEISHTDRFFFFFLIKRVEKGPTNLPSLLIQASKLPQMFGDFHFFSAVSEDLYKHGEDNTISTINLWISWIISLIINN